MKLKNKNFIYCYPIKEVLKVSDGDSYWFLVDLGMGNYVKKNIRLARFNTPELFSGPPEERAKGKAAKQFVLDWLQDAKSLHIITKRDKTGKYGRLIAQVCKNDMYDLGQALLESGHIK